MGSKFGHAFGVQPPPDVCRKPPDTLPIPTPPLNERILIAWASIHDEHTSHWHDYIATFPLHPQTPITEWDGQAEDDRNKFVMMFEWDAPTQTGWVDLKFYWDGVLSTHHEWFDIPFRSLDPLTSPLLYYEEDPNYGHIACRILE